MDRALGASAAHAGLVPSPRCGTRARTSALLNAARREHVQWAREHLVSWIGRRLRGQSSGDGLVPKRPDLLPL